jgi:hypothetical protein
LSGWSGRQAAFRLLLASKRASPISDRLWHATPPPASCEQEHRHVHDHSPAS